MAMVRVVGSITRQTNPVVLDGDAIDPMRLLERQSTACRLGMLDHVGKCLAHDMEYLEFLVSGKGQHLDLVVELEMHAAQPFHMRNRIAKRVQEPVRVHVSPEIGDEFTYTAMRDAERLIDFRKILEGPRIVVPRYGVTQERCTHPHAREVLCERIMDFASEQLAFLHHPGVKRLLCEPSILQSQTEHVAYCGQQRRNRIRQLTGGIQEEIEHAARGAAMVKRQYEYPLLVGRLLAPGYCNRTCAFRRGAARSVAAQCITTDTAIPVHPQGTMIKRGRRTVRRYQAQFAARRIEQAQSGCPSVGKPHNRFEKLGERCAKLTLADRTGCTR